MKWMSAFAKGVCALGRLDLEARNEKIENCRLFLASSVNGTCQLFILWLRVFIVHS